jgi:hypothetical protein
VGTGTSKENLNYKTAKQNLNFKTAKQNLNLGAQIKLMQKKPDL